jgi:hypothetical protein
MNHAELLLPKRLLGKAIKSGNEFGWREGDVLEAIEAARQVPMAIIGGQVQYVWPDVTCELYWLSYDSEGRKKNEDWITFCNRTAGECVQKFSTLITTDIEKEAIGTFEVIKTKYENGGRLSDHQLFILYFDDTETDSFAN